MVLAGPRTGQDRPGPARTGQDRPGPARTGQDRPGPARTSSLSLVASQRRNLSAFLR